MNDEREAEIGPAAATAFRALQVGITGGIACGKSEVGRVAREMGIAVLDTDDVAHDVLAPGGEAHEAVVARFGPAIRRPDGTIDRSALGERVFADAEERAALNAIVHPPVRRRWRVWKDDMRAAGRPSMVIIPLLFEVGAGGEWDAVVCVAAPEAVVLDRLRRQGMKEEQARRRIAAQMDLKEKKQRSDYIIENTGSLADLREETQNLLNRIFRKETHT